MLGTIAQLFFEKLVFVNGTLFIHKLQINTTYLYLDALQLKHIEADFMQNKFSSGKVDILESERRKLIVDRVNTTWSDTMKELKNSLDMYASKYNNRDMAEVKFEIAKHNKLRKSIGNLLREIGKGDFYDGIRSEKRAAAMEVHINSFVNKLELMHETEFEEKLRILRRRADATEFISKDFFNDVIDYVSEGAEALKYKQAIESAEKDFIMYELCFSDKITKNIRR